MAAGAAETAAAAAKLDPDLLEQLGRTLKMKRIVVVTGGVGINGSRAAHASLVAESRRAILVTEGMPAPAEVGSDSFVIEVSRLGSDLRSRLGRKLLPAVGHLSSSAVVFESAEEMAADEDFRAITLGQQVYFVTPDDGGGAAIRERYSVGGREVSTHLWTYDGDGEKFVRAGDGGVNNDDLVTRRSDFRGANLRVYVEQQAPYLYIQQTDREIRREFVDQGGGAATAAAEVREIYPEQMQGLFRALQVIGRDSLLNRKFSPITPLTQPGRHGARTELHLHLLQA